MGGQGDAQRGGGQLRVVGGGEPRGRLLDVPPAADRVPYEEGQRPAVQGGVGGAGEQRRGGDPEQFAVGPGRGVRGGPQSVGDGGDAARGARVDGPAGHAAADSAGVLLGESGEQFVGALVSVGDQGVDEGVGVALAVRVQQGLGGRGDGRGGQGRQPPVVDEPGAQQGLRGPGVGHQELTGGSQEPVVAARAVRHHEPPQQIGPLLGGQRERRPEPRPEVLRHPPLPGSLDDPPGEHPEHPEVRRAVGQPEQRLAEQPHRPPRGQRGARVRACARPVGAARGGSAGAGRGRVLPGRAPRTGRRGVRGGGVRGGRGGGLRDVLGGGARRGRSARPTARTRRGDVLRRVPHTERSGATGWAARPRLAALRPVVNQACRVLSIGRPLLARDPRFRLGRRFTRRQELVRGLDQTRQPTGQFVRTPVPGKVQQRLDDGSDAVLGDGQRPGNRRRSSGRHSAPRVRGGLRGAIPLVRRPV
ncbi:hypothetical protein MWG58_06235 [Streptomyces sp. WAC00276]|uniref:hypothetical protein n=1 Tax=Streptomyces sp. WAC00276 TaxID=2933778 RepID=UPI001FFE3AB6|nr:hypothetical protein [Streptomyces sp. WAC00276]MCK2140619.1 hypothetical protein [Streptomyces sp. WAC00276]